MSNNKIKISIYEDNKPLRDSIVRLIETYDEFELIKAYPNAINIIEDAATDPPEVILMDIGMPGMTGIEATKLLKERFPEIKVIMQTVFDDDNRVFHSICAGAVGYILKKSPPLQIIEAIRQAAAGGGPMTPVIAAKVLELFRLEHPNLGNEQVKLGTREKEILLELTKGFSYKMIAEHCNISLDTVRFHIKNIYEKLHVHSMSEAIVKALKDKLV